VNRDGHFGGRILPPGLGTHPILLLVEQKLVLLLFAEVTKMVGYAICFQNASMVAHF
jgi:hypothetical protein